MLKVNALFFTFPRSYLVDPVVRGVRIFIHWFFSFWLVALLSLSNIRTIDDGKNKADYSDSCGPSLLFSTLFFVGFCRFCWLDEKEVTRHINSCRMMADARSPAAVSSRCPPNNHQAATELMINRREGGLRCCCCRRHSFLLFSDFLYVRKGLMPGLCVRSCYNVPITREWGALGEFSRGWKIRGGRYSRDEGSTS